MASEAPRLSDQDVSKVLALARAADSVELKLTVPEESRRSALTALGIDPLDAHMRQVYFFDTPDLALDVIDRPRLVMISPKTRLAVTRHLFYDSPGKADGPRREAQATGPLQTSFANWP